MSVSEYRIRIRPQRLVVLLPRHARRSQFLLAVDFLSRIWGGRYSQILPVDGGALGQLAQEHLKASRPDLVYGIDLNHDEWSAIAQECCQPRRYVPLNASSISELYRTNRASLITSYAPINKIIQDHPAIEISPFVLWNLRPRSGLAPLFAAAFGMHIAKDRDILADRLKVMISSQPRGNTYTSFLQCFRTMEKKWSWLDMISYKLDVFIHRGGHLFSPPTLVLLEEPLADLALFWTLRTLNDASALNPILPVLTSSVESDVDLAGIADWISSSRLDSNYVRITSWRSPSEGANRLARRLRARLRGSNVRHCDVVPAVNLLPVVTPRDSERTQQVGRDEFGTVFTAPPPEHVDEVNKHFMVDLMKDVSTGRVPDECFPPPVRQAVDSLQAITLPSITIVRLPLVGLGVDALNLRCEPGERITFQLPSSREMLEGYLTTKEFEVRKDEKRICYEPVIEMLGGLTQTAETFSGLGLRVLEVLEEDGPLAFREISSRLSNQESSRSPSDDEWWERCLLELPPVAQEISRKRLSEFRRSRVYSTDSVEKLLEIWLARSVVSRQCHLGPCPFCDDKSWLPDIDLRSPTLCPGCHQRRPTRQSVRIGYALNPLVNRAINQGIVPVVLTIRFLKNLTSRGFSFLPGVKGRCPLGAYDFDVFASCDGILAVAECKTMGATPPGTSVWKEAIKQFDRLAAAARRCGAPIAVFASQADAYPRHVATRLRAMASEDLSILLLNRHDLEQGHTQFESREGHKRRLTLHDVIPAPSSNRRTRKRRKAPRIVRFGGVTQSSRG
jgi:hypothetical protein